MNDILANDTFGEKLASTLRNRLADLMAADVASDLFELPGNPCPYDKDILEINLVDGYRLLLQVSHSKSRTLQTGEIDWGRVRRLKILSMEV